MKNSPLLANPHLRSLWRSPLRLLTVLACFLSAAYWLGMASDRYVSESRLIIQSTNLHSGASFDLGSLISGSTSGNRADQLLLREHLRSPDMAEQLDAKLGLRTHYSSEGDWLSRLWGGADASREAFHAYYLRRISIEFDEFSGVLVVKAQAYDAALAQKIAQSLVQEGENFMNRMAHAIAQDQVSFLEEQVQSLNTKVQSTRQALLGFQEKERMISPEAVAQTIATIVANLQGQLVELQAQRSALQAYLVADHPNIVLLNQRISALEKQISQEQAKLAAPGGKTLNRAAEAFAQLELQAKFALDMYKTALTALEQGRLDATRTLKKVSVLQQPNLPQEATEPRRLYTTSVWLLGILLLAGIMNLILAIVRDHKD
ncbi:MAG: chain-length determining protein [Pseudomonadota bacterium]|nr:chain-length determining protein [Pseudomonadota bacterium]